MTPERITRINYTLDVAKINKASMIEEFGIGEDLAPTLFGWLGEELKMVCAIAPVVPKKRRFESMFMAIVAMRRGCDADAVTIISDAYFSDFGSEVSIEQRFADGDQSVTEALLVISTEEDTVMRIQPYRVGLGRKVSYGEPSLRSVDPEVGYASGFKRALQTERGEAIDFKELQAAGISIEMTA